MSATAIEQSAIPAVRSAERRNETVEDLDAAAGQGQRFGELLGDLQALRDVTVEYRSTLATKPVFGSVPEGDGTYGRLANMRQEERDSSVRGPGRIAGANAAAGGREEPASQSDTPTQESSNGSSIKPDANTSNAEGIRDRSGSLPQTLSQSTPADQAKRIETPSAAPPEPRPSSANTQVAGVPPAALTPSPPAANADRPLIPTVTAASKTAPIGQTQSGPESRGSGTNNANASTVRSFKDAEKTGQSTTKARASRSAPTAESSGKTQKSMFARIARMIQNGPRGRETAARIELDPPNLGHVRVHLRLKDDALTVRLAAESHDARRVLLSQVGELKTAISQQGVQIQRMEFPMPQGESDTHDTGGGLSTGLSSHDGTGESSIERETSAHRGDFDGDALGDEVGDTPNDESPFIDGYTVDLRLDVKV